jgi:hypothetical protein
LTKTAAATGAVSGCVVWVILSVVPSMCLVPVACVFTLFTTTSDLAAGIIGPLVCPKGTQAQIEVAPTTYVDDQGFTRESTGREMVCVDEAGVVAARPAHLPNWIWTGLVSGAALALAAGLGLVFAAPAGVVLGRRIRSEASLLTNSLAGR